MKSFVMAVILAVLLSGFSIFYTNRLESASRRLSDMNHKIAYALNNDDFAGAAEKSELIESELRALEPFLAMFGNHEEIDRIEANLAELKSYAENGQKNDALAKSGVISILFEHLPKNSRISTENIL